MKSRLLAALTGSLVCGAAAGAEPADLDAMSKWVSEYPKKSLAYDKRSGKRMQFIAEDGITVSEDFEVLGIDASEGPPQLLWIFRGRTWPTKCEFIEYPADRKAADVTALLSSFKDLKKDKQLIALAAETMVAHISCTSEEPFNKRARLTITMPGETRFVSYQSQAYGGEAAFIANFQKNKADLFVIPLN